MSAEAAPAVVALNQRYLLDYPHEAARQLETMPPAEAAELLQQHHFDLVVLDIQMKGESGLQLLQKIVKEKESLPVILSTAFNCYKDDFSSWLADAYVVKSSDLTELKAEVSRILAKKRG